MQLSILLYMALEKYKYERKMNESEILSEFERWKKLHTYLNLEKKGHTFSDDELEEIFHLLNSCLLKKREKIEDCVKDHGIQRVMAHQC